MYCALLCMRSRKKMFDYFMQSNQIVSLRKAENSQLIDRFKNRFRINFERLGDL